jgi:hypothetical protein
MAKISRRSRNRTEDKRQGHKTARQETRRVLENGVMPKVAHGVHWAPSIEQPPLPDDAVTGGPKPKKKARKPKERCPVNGTHEWYREEGIETEHFGGHWHWWRKDFWVEKYTRDYTVQTRTCIHCWKVQKRSRNEFGYYRGWSPWRPK